MLCQMFLNWLQRKSTSIKTMLIPVDMVSYETIIADTVRISNLNVFKKQRQCQKQTKTLTTRVYKNTTFC